MNEFKTIMLDYQSRTSVSIAEIMIEQYWKQNPVFEQAGADFINKIGGSLEKFDRLTLCISSGSYIRSWRNHR